MKATLSIMGLYNYDPTIFNNLHIPSGMNKATLIAMITTRCAELELLYSDPDFLKNYIGVWSSIELPAWEKMHASTQLEYNPIENYDRMESITDTITASNTSSMNTNETGNATSNGNTTVITDDTTIFAGKNDSVTTVENKVAGFNSSTLVNNNDNTTDVGATSSGSSDYDGDQRTTISNSSGVINARTESGSGTSNTTNTHTARIHGNIGVTTAPQMIKEFREIESFSAYDYIVNRFKLEFCVMVY